MWLAWAKQPGIIHLIVILRKGERERDLHLTRCAQDFPDYYSRVLINPLLTEMYAYPGIICTFRVFFNSEVNVFSIKLSVTLSPILKWSDSPTSGFCDSPSNFERGGGLGRDGDSSTPCLPYHRPCTEIYETLWLYSHLKPV